MFDLSLDTSSVNLNPEPKIPEPPRLLLTPLETPGEFLLVIDNSSLEYFTTCPTSARYKLVLRREAQAKNAALVFGGAIHEGLEAFLKKQFYKDVPFMTDGMTTDGDISEAGQNEKIVSFFTNHPAPLDEYRTVNNALAVLSAYRQRATLPDYQWEIQSDENGPIIERAFELPLGVIEVNAFIGMPWLSVEQQDACNDKMKGFPSEDQLNLLHTINSPVWVSKIHVAWSGRIDAVAKCGDPFIPRIVDHKTGMVKPEEYAISNPVLGYVWAGRQLWPDLNIGGFALNALATKKPAAGLGMTDIGPRGGKPALELFRSYFEYSDAQLKEWEGNCLAIVSDFVHCLVRDYYPRHTKQCFAKYGRCQYHDVCCQDNEQVRLNMLQSEMFRPVTWNPTAGR